MIDRIVVGLLLSVCLPGVSLLIYAICGMGISLYSPIAHPVPIWLYHAVGVWMIWAGLVIAIIVAVDYLAKRNS